MLVGLDGTVGGSLIDAAQMVMGQRAEKVWRSLNEPIPFSQFTAQKSGNAVVRAVGGGVKAIGAQIGKVAEGASTGSIADAEYFQASVRKDLQAMADWGYVGQICRAYTNQRGGQSFYLRGPTTLGLQDNEIVANAFKKIEMEHRKGDELIVIGYSRGGLNAVNLCDRVIKNGGYVDLLILLDPVDRDVALGKCSISAGVRNCVLVQRGGTWISWKPFLRDVKIFSLDLKVPDVWLTKSRWYFGLMVEESDKNILTSGELAARSWDATHAAFGGVPWTGDNPDYMNQAGDRAKAAEMAKFVNEATFRFIQWDPGLKLTFPVQSG